MKFLIVSDTHGRDETLQQAIRKEKPFDVLIHCGDGEGLEDHILNYTHSALFMVRGNNDFFSGLTRELEFQLEGKRFFVTHGHTYGVSMGHERILEEARARRVDFVIYGHTHRPVIEPEGAVTVINPGSLSYPRQEGRKPSYVVMELEENEPAKISIKYC